MDAFSPHEAAEFHEREEGFGSLFAAARMQLGQQQSICRAAGAT
jgi:hypothetical protein